MKRRTFIPFAMAGLVMSPAITAQTTRAGAELITEMQTDFKAANWVNFLQLSANMSLSRSWAIEAKTVSVANTRSVPLLDDLQCFSNIEDENLALALSVLDISWSSRSGLTRIYAGVHNVNEDFFTQEGTSLFTNSSCGIFPTISANYQIANYPYASVGFGMSQRFGEWEVRGALYNGRGYNRFTGRDNVFRFTPGADGLFTIASINYTLGYGTYDLGCAMHHGYDSAEDLGAPSTPTTKRTSAAPWVSAEIPVASRWWVLGQASVNTSRRLDCRHYEAIGAVTKLHDITLGLIANNARFSHVTERAIELTSRLPLSEHAYLQPSLHVIFTGAQTNTAMLLRMSVEI